MGLIVFDTSAFVGLLDRTDPVHPAASEAFSRLGAQRRRFAASVITWSELGVGARLGYFPLRSIDGLFREAGIELLDVGRVIADRAAILRAGYIKKNKRSDLRLPDALILASAESRPEGSTVVTADRQWARVPGLEVELVLL